MFEEVPNFNRRSESRRRLKIAFLVLSEIFSKHTPAMNSVENNYSSFRSNSRESARSEQAQIADLLVEFPRLGSAAIEGLQASPISEHRAIGGTALMLLKLANYDHPKGGAVDDGQDPQIDGLGS